MSAAFVSLLQHALHEKAGSRDAQVHDAQVSSSTGKFPTPCGTGKSFTTCLHDLVSVATEIARMDEMLAQAKANVPAGTEAQKWHQISIQALTWKRQAHALQQEDIFAELKALIACDGLAKSTGAENSAYNARSDSEPEAERSPEARTREPEAPPSPTGSVAHEPTAEEQREDHPVVVGSLRNDLERLREYDIGRCLLVRKIKRLGLESAQKLQGYFQRYGAVTEVLVAHSFEKPSAKRRSGRFRPAAIGFVVMDAEGAAGAILSAGESHVVEDGAEACEVLVQAYNPQVADLGA